MILNFPSGFYRTVLPPAPGNKGNVTFTISNNVPPRGALFFLKMSNNLAVSSQKLIATPPQGVLGGGSLRSFRSIGVIDRIPRPIGAVIEWNDSNATSGSMQSIQSQSLDETIEFAHFGDDSANPINDKLVIAYKQFQKSLMTVSSQSLSKQIEIENIERQINASQASLSATCEALKIMIDDVELQESRDNLILQIADYKSQIAILRDEITQLNAQRATMSDSVRNLAKVIT